MILTTADVEAFRAEALALMVDTCTIRRGGSRTLNTTTGEYEATPASQVYSGACRVKPRDNADRVVDAGGENVSLFPYVVSVPVDATAYEVDDRVTVTACALDPAAVGLVLRIKQINVGSHLTARRLSCEVNAG